MPHSHRLGRIVQHDARSRRYAVSPTDPASLVSIRHTRYAPILNQGDLGCCTGCAAIGALSTGGLFEALEPYLQEALCREDDALGLAVQVYATATTLDEWPGSWPPDDTGSSGLAVAKTLHHAGWISGYRHAFGLDAALTALAQAPVITGLPWYSSMYAPNEEGRLRIAVDAVVDGGHEVVLDELDVERQRVWMTNSWGPGWGIAGRAWLSWADFARLLSEQGDVTVLVPRSESAPLPSRTPCRERLSGWWLQLRLAVLELVHRL